MWYTVTIFVFLSDQKLLRLLLLVLVVHTISIHLLCPVEAAFPNYNVHDDICYNNEETYKYSKSHVDDNIASVETLRTNLFPHEVQTLQKNFDREKLAKVKAHAVSTNAAMKVLGLIDPSELTIDEIYGTSAIHPPTHIMRRTQGVCLKFGRMCSRVYVDWLMLYQLGVYSTNSSDSDSDTIIQTPVTNVQPVTVHQSDYSSGRVVKPTGEELRQSATVISLKEEIDDLRIMISRLNKDAHLEAEVDVLIQLYLQEIVVDNLLYISQVNVILWDIVLVFGRSWDWLISIFSVNETLAEWEAMDNKGPALYDSFSGSMSTLKLHELSEEYAYSSHLDEKSDNNGDKNPMTPSGKSVWFTEVIVVGICGASVIFALVIWLIADGNDEFLVSAQSHNSMENALYVLRWVSECVQRQGDANNRVFYGGADTTGSSSERLDEIYNVIVLYRSSVRMELQCHTFFILRVQIICCVLTTMYIISLGISLQAMVKQSVAGNMLGWLVSEGTVELCLYAAAFVSNVPSLCLLVSTAWLCHQKLMHFEEAALLQR